MVSVFVGRTEELRILAEVIRAPERPSAALVVAVAGTGKSRLLMEARRSAPRVRSFAVVGFESETQVPLAAAAGLLRALSGIPEHGGVVDALVFRRPAVSPDAEGRSDSGAFEPLRIFEAAHRALSSVKTALLVIDDLQWVDDLSLALCHYLIRAAAESQQRLVILAATRPDGPGEQLFDGLPEGSLRRIDMGPLGEAEGTALAQAVDPRLDAELARGLWRQADGNPFWLEALARYGTVEGRLDRVLTRRLRGAGRDAGTLLGTLALAGRPLSVTVAGEVLDRQPDAVESALQVLVERGLIEIDQNGARPAHDLIRASAIAQLPVDLRLKIHGGLAERFERDAGTDLQLLRLALEHRRAAGLALLPLAARLAASPRRRLLGADGVADLGAVADEADPLAPDTVALHAGVAALAYELGQHEQALARWSLVAEHGADLHTRASAALDASRAAYALGTTDEARELLNRSRELFSDDSALAVEQTTHEAAICLWLEQRGPDGRELAQRAAAMARQLATGQLGDRRNQAELRRAVVDALRVEYEAAIQQGDPAALLEIAERRQAEARRVGLQEALEASLALGAALRQNGRVRQAVARFRRVWTDAQRAVLPRLSVDAGFWLARTLMLTGELEEAEAIVRETRELARRVGDVPRARHRVGQVDAGVQLERGRVADGLAVLDAEIARKANEHHRIVLHADRAVWAARLDGAEAADMVRDHLEAAEACVSAVGCPRCTGEFLVLAAEAFGRVGRHEAAGLALERRDALEFPLEDLDRLLYAHARALAVEDAEERRGGLDAALAAAERSPYRLSTLWMRLDLGRTLATLGAERAVVELERAAAEAEARGANTVRELAERSLRALGVRTWKRGVAGAPLTAREEEVARLVAAGATNREVASTLFLSPKTVERHLVNLFRKLDVRNRTELAARLAEPGAKRTGIPR